MKSDFKTIHNTVIGFEDGDVYASPYIIKEIKNTQ